MLALGCALAMLAAIAAIAPAFAAAQAAVEEYELGELPSPDGDEPTRQDGDESARQSSRDDDAESAGAAPSTPGSGSNPTSGAPGSGGGDQQRGGEHAGSGGGPKGVQLTPTSEQTPTVTSEPSDGGGAPVLLITLAVIAAVCTGLAIWRLRRSTGDGSKGVGLSETSATSATSKS